MADASFLGHPISTASLSLVIDASATHVGASLQQQPRGASGWRPQWGFFSRKLEPAQINYSAYNTEFLACYLGTRYFLFMLEGRSFTIFTDHKPLTFGVRQSSEPWMARQCRQLSYVVEFTSAIRHVKGANTTVADTLARPFEVWAAVEAANANVPSRSSAAATAASISLVFSSTYSCGASITWRWPPSSITIKEALTISSLLIQAVPVGGVSL